MKPIGPSFSAELKAAGLLNLAFSWGEDGAISFGEEMTPQQIAGVQAVYAAHDPDLPAPVEVPKAVTMRQARLALLAQGMLGQIDAAIDSLPSPQKEEARIEWEYSQEVQRDKPLVLNLAPALGLDSAQLDALFIAAATL
jgi:hypothetical protein